MPNVTDCPWRQEDPRIQLLGLSFGHRTRGPTVADVNELERAERLRRETARQRIALIENDIDLAIAFLRIALTELDIRNHERVGQLLDKARIAYLSTAKLLAEMADTDDWQRLHDNHEALADAIREVERRQLRQESEIHDRQTAIHGEPLSFGSP